MKTLVHFSRFFYGFSGFFSSGYRGYRFGAPATPICTAANQTVIVTIKNYPAATINFAINNVNAGTLGARIQTFTAYPVRNRLERLLKRAASTVIAVGEIQSERMRLNY